MKHTLLICLAILIALGLPLAYVAFWWLPAVRHDVRTGLEASNLALQTQLLAARREAIAESRAWRYTLDHRLWETQQALDRQITAARKDARIISRDALLLADDRADQAILTAATGLLSTTDTLGRLREDLKPTLDALPPAILSARDFTTDAKASWDDLYPELNSLVQTANVAGRGGAEVAVEAGNVAPAIAADAKATMADTRKIVHRAASPFRWIAKGIAKGAAKIVRLIVP